MNERFRGIYSFFPSAPKWETPNQVKSTGFHDSLLRAIGGQDNRWDFVGHSGTEFHTKDIGVVQGLLNKHVINVEIISIYKNCQQAINLCKFGASNVRNNSVEKLASLVHQIPVLPLRVLPSD